MTDIIKENGKNSSTRIAMLLCVVTACAVTVAVVVGSITGTPIDTNVPWLVGGLLSAGFGGKVFQKAQENK